MSHTPDDDESEDRGPSKSERKRNAHDAQKLGEALIELTSLDLDALGLPEPLVDAIREARRIKSRGGLVRQRQYVGKLMRSVDLEPIRAALAARSEHAARETQRFTRVEHWRDRLIAEGAPALDELMQWRPGMDRAEWLRRVAAAQAERARLGSGGAASRELFRALRALLDRATIPE
ncbi:MAG TPA: ribosome biogenesis factor YjgA [Steroidobacteraceae bacterium]|nr:ribosome biogenesis factor YjgA [Steroidobacteraceae bacterium]